MFSIETVVFGDLYIKIIDIRNRNKKKDGNNQIMSSNLDSQRERHAAERLVLQYVYMHHWN